MFSSVMVGLYWEPSHLIDRNHTLVYPVVLDSSEKPVVFVVWSDPKPHDFTLIEHSKGPIVDAHTR